MYFGMKVIQKKQKVLSFSTPVHSITKVSFKSGVQCRVADNIMKVNFLTLTVTIWNRMKPYR